jgi:hypothetical protein
VHFTNCTFELNQCVRILASGMQVPPAPRDHPEREASRGFLAGKEKEKKEENKRMCKMTRNAIANRFTNLSYT